MSVLTDIAESLTTELNDAAAADAFDQSFVAQRRYLPLYKLGEMKALHVTVVPKGESVQQASRNGNQHDYQVDVAVQQRVGGEGDVLDQSVLDGLMTLVEQISDYFAKRRLGAFATAVWVRSEHEPVYAPDHLEQMRQFTAVITFTYRVIR